MKKFSNLLDLVQEPLMHPELIGGVIDAALTAVDPYNAVRRSLESDDSGLVSSSRSIRLVAIGKASELMAQAALEDLGGRVTAGVCVAKYPVELLQAYPQITVIKGDHPVPGEGSLRAGKAIQDLLFGLQPDNLVLVLLSGGGSALAALPAEGISLAEIQRMTDGLLKHGQTIGEINAIRKHLDILKGGGLLRMAQPAQVVTLILSDVIGDPLDVIASGPTVPDPTTFHDALSILEKSGIPLVDIPAIHQRIQAGCKGNIPETVKGSELDINPACNILIGSNGIACTAARDYALLLGMQAEVVTTSLRGEAKEAGGHLADFAREMATSQQKGVFIFGGETTVTVRGKGLGGRNLETALGAVEGMAELADCVLVTLATDGDDGPSQAAGAVVTGETAKTASRLGLDPAAFLAKNDSFHFFEALGNLLITGPTGTNVNDISFIFRL